MGRSRGGLTTKIHAVVEARGLPIRLGLTPGQAYDGEAAMELLNALPEAAMVLAYKAYDANAIREMIDGQGAWANIPPKSNRKDPICFSPHLYKARNLVERFFNKIKHFRRIATRYDKLPQTTAMIKLARHRARRPRQAASIRVWLRAYESTAYESTPRPVGQGSNRNTNFPNPLVRLRHVQLIPDLDNKDPFDRRSFARWSGAGRAVVRAPQAGRNAAGGQKNAAFGGAKEPHGCVPTLARYPYRAARRACP